MNFLQYDGADLHAEGVPLREIADSVGTPCFVYSRSTLVEAFRAYQNAFGNHSHLICYAVKANSSLAVLNLFARLGSGFDIVSGGELARVLAAGGDPGRIVFSGVGKTRHDMGAALKAGVKCFNVESESELDHLQDVAASLNQPARVSLRVNPDVDAKTHAYISTGLKENKFGVAFEEARRLYRKAASKSHLRVVGIDCHIGSQITELGPFQDAFARVLGLAEDLARDGIQLEHIDLGGGLGIRYHDESPPSPAEFVGTVLRSLGGRKMTVLLEPGRSLVGNAGLLLTRVEYLKPGSARNFAIVDAAMNDLIRPALYEAWHDIRPVRQREGSPRSWQIVGPICETGDFLGHDRSLTLEEGDLLAVLSAGAYGMSMSSNYNSRPRAAEVMVDGSRQHLIRAREKVQALFAGEVILPKD
jgi:diaminopimelate decarboxylase